MKPLVVVPDEEALDGSETRPVRIADVLQEQYDSATWIVPNLIATGAVGILSADYFVGKSTLLAQLFACVASGQDFLGYPVPRPVPCLYWQAEGSRKLFAGRIRDQCRNLGLDLDTLDLSFQPRALDPLPFDSPQFASFVKDSGAGLIACDTFGYFWDGDENSARDWKQKVMKPLKALGRALGTSFYLVHHEGKPNELRKGRHKIRGTSAMGGDADTVTRLEYVTGDPDRRRLFFDKVKEAEEQPSLTLGFDKVRALFTRESEAVSAAASDTGTEKYRQKIVATKAKITSVLSRQPNLSGRQLYKLVLGAKPLFDDALSGLQRDILVIGEPGPRDSVLWKNASATPVNRTSETE
jgi:RecA-family ATPase